MVREIRLWIGLRGRPLGLRAWQKRSATFCILVAAVLSAGCSQRNTAEARLRQLVTARIAKDQQLQGQSIAVAAKGDVVTLAGVTQTDAQRQAAAADANIVGAVTQVVNRITSLQTLQAALQAKLDADPALKGASIVATVGPKAATLTGQAGSNGQKFAAQADASQLLGVVPGVKLVDEIAVAAPPAMATNPAPVRRRQRTVAMVSPLPAQQPRPRTTLELRRRNSAPQDAISLHRFLAVSVRRPWAGDTGVMLEPGDRVTVRASGVVSMHAPAGPGWWGFQVAPRGKSWDSCSMWNGFPAPGRRCYSLVGRIGHGQPFEVGSNKTFTANRGGVLLLGANQQAAEFSDDSGSWAVHVYVTGPVGTPPGSAASNGTALSPSPAPSRQTVSVSGPPAPPPPPALVTLPAGTVLEVRLDQRLGSDTSKGGQTFRGALAAPAAVGGQIAVPADALVTGVVLYAHSAGHFKGRSELRLALSALRYNGNRYTVAASTWDRKSAARGRNTAKKVGIGAVAGGILGGLLGGGRGAIEGAGGGAGAGAAVQALTKPPEVVLPAEAVIRVRLAAPLTVRPAGAFLGP